MNVRLWISRLVIVLMGGGLLFALALPIYASHNFVYNLRDDLDADDVDGIVDLNGVGLDRSHMSAQNKLWLRWQWDVHQIEAGEALHGCILFDATANGLADYALCVSLDESLAIAPNSPTLYSCNNQKDDHCGSNPVVTPASSVVCTVFTDVNDIFGDEGRNDPQASTTFDTRVRCSVVLDELNDATPMNVCSYTAMPPESAAEDCVFEPSTTAFLVIEKNAGGDVNTSFDFALSPAGRDGESSFQVTGAAAYPPIPINADTDHTLSEVNLTNGWVLEQAGCEANQQAVGNFDGDHNEISNIKVIAGQMVLCTFENTLYGEITFIKNVVGGNAQPNQWRFALDGGPSDIAHNQIVSLPVGNYTVSEDGGAANNANYTLSGAGGACTLDNGAILLTVGNLAATCAITNTVRPGAIVVKKETTPNGAAQTFIFSPSYGNNFTLSDNGQHNSGPLAPGIYSVQEINIPLGWQLDSAPCSDGSPANQINLGPDETVTCTFYNSALPANIGLQKASAQPKINLEATATYYYTITNQALAPLSQVEVIDNKCSPVTYVNGNSNNNAYLEVGEKWRYTCARTLNVDATNVATATAQTPLNGQVKASASAFVDVLPAVSLSKTANPTAMPEPGGAVAFTLTIQNDVRENIRVLQLTDDHNLSSACLALINKVIPVNGSLSCSYNATFTTPGDYPNNASVTVRDDENNQATTNAAATVIITDVPSALSVSKSASPQALSEPGGNVLYTVSVVNTSVADSVTLNSIEDDADNDGDTDVTYPAGDICNVTSLAPTQQATCTYTQTRTGAPGDSFANRATVKATDDDGAVVSNEDTAVVVIVDQGALLKVEKRPDADSIAEPGGEVTFFVVITNTSPADSVLTTALQDSLYHNITTSGHDGIVSTTCAAGQQIEAQGGRYTCSFVAQVGGNAGDVHENTLIVLAEDGQGNPVVGVASAQVQIADQPAKLTVAKSAEPTNVPESGGDVTYHVLITNSSAADAVRIDQVVDDQFDVLEEFCAEKLPVTLPPQASLSCTFSNFVRGPAGASHVNVVTVSGIDDDQQPVSGQDSASVTFGDTSAVLSVLKTAQPNSVPESGGQVQYRVVITNASSADAIIINSVQDDRFGDLAADCTPTPITTLQPGEAIGCLFTRFLEGDVGEPHVNQVTVSGASDDGELVSAQGQAIVTFTDSPSSMTVSKTPSRTTVPPSGAVVTFTVEVKNTSAMDTLTLNSLNDSVYGNVTNVNHTSLLRTTCQAPQKMAAGKSYLCRFAVMLVGSVGDQHTNLLTASAIDDDGVARTANAQASVLVAGPLISASKRDGLAIDLNQNGIVNPGDTISYTVVVRNKGNTGGQVRFTDLVDANTTLVNGSVSSTQGATQTSASSVMVDLGTVAASQQATIRFQVRVADPLPESVTKITNQGLLTSNEAPLSVTDDPDTAAPNDATITSLSAQSSPELTVLKRDTLAVDTDQSGAASPGDTLEYLITITNSGNQTAIDVLLEDTPGAGARLVVGSVQTSQGVVTQGNQSGANSVAVQLGALAGPSATVRFRVIVQKPLPAGVTQISNQALVSGDNFSPTPSNDPDTPTPDDPTHTLITTFPLLAAFQRDSLLVDGDGDRQPSPGDTLAYQITVHNTGSQSANQVVFTLTPDPHTALVVGSVQSSQGVINQGNSAGNTSVQVTLGALPAGDRATVSFQVVIANPLPIGVVQVGAQGNVRSSNAPAITTDDPDTSAINDPTRTAVTAAPVLEMTKRDLLFHDVDGDDQVSIGDTLVYILRLANVGNVAATNVRIQDLPDAHTLLQHGKVQVNQGEVARGNSGGDREVIVMVDALPPNTTVHIGFRVTIQATAEEQVTNQAQAQYDNPNAAQGAAAIAITSDDPDTPTVNDPTVTPLKAAPAGSLIYLPLVQKP